MSKHPLHPALVHFPIACWSLGSVADLASLWWPAEGFAGFLLVCGTVIAIPVMATGLLDTRRLKDAPHAVDVLGLHMTFVAVAWLAYALSLIGRWDGEVLQAPGLVPLAMSGLGFVSLLTAGWFGGQLVYTHGVGVTRSHPGAS